MSGSTAQFQEVQFPQEISYGSKGGSGFSTTIFTTTAGMEQRNINWSQSKGKWDVSYGIKDIADMTAIIAFFMAMAGRAYAFRFKDWADYQVQNQVIATGDGKTTIFQIIKTYTPGAYIVSGTPTLAWTRTIYKPVPGTMTQVLVNGAYPGAGSYSVNDQTGQITFTTAPAAGASITVAYVEFDVPARFDTDLLDVSQDFWQTQSWPNIPIVEVRL